MPAGPHANSETVPAAPFVRLLKKRLAHYQAQAGVAGVEHFQTDPPLSPWVQLSVDLGWGEKGTRRLYRYLRSMKCSKRVGPREAPTDTFMRAIVEDALDHLGVAFHEVYPDIVERESLPLEADAYCASCREDVTPIGGICPWCEIPIGGAPLPLTLEQAQARALELHRRGTMWSYAVIADVMAAYHGVERTPDSWRRYLLMAGAEKRPGLIENLRPFKSKQTA